MKKTTNLRRRFRYLYRRLFYWLERHFSDECQDPWRCEECGSLNIEQKVWIDPNTGTQTSQDSVDRNECWCNDCEEHTNQVQESELLQTIDDWFENDLEPDDPEVISGLDFGDFATEEEFDAACKKLWDARSPEEKIHIWQTLTNRSSEK